MWYIAELRWWRAKRLLNDAQDNHAILRMGIDEDGRDLNKIYKTLRYVKRVCQNNGGKM